MSQKKIAIRCEGAARLDLDQLIAMQGALKTLTKDNEKKLRKQITEDGFKAPFFVWSKADAKGKKPTYKILDGHQRLTVLTHLRDDGYEVPPLPVALIEARDEKEAFESILQFSSSYGTMTDDGLSEFLKLADIPLIDVADNFVLSDVDLGGLLSDQKKRVEEDDFDGDAAAASIVDPITRPGDVWLLGNHRLLCGDATKKEHVDRLMDGKKANLVLTDPPYGLGDSSSSKNEYDTYDDTHENLVETVAGFFPLAQAVAPCVVLTPGNANQRLYPSPKWTMAWFTPAGVGSGPWGFSCWQPILCYGTDPKLSKGKGRHPDAIVHTEAAQDFGHPCTKPIRFWSWLMERTSEKGELIYEPFTGSGTTFIAAEQLGRVCYGLELSPNYCDVVVKRWEEFTGQKAELVRSE